MIATASMVGQVILIAVMPLLTRLFTPAEFGIAATGLAGAQLATSVAGWRFEWFVPNAKSEPEASRLLMLATIALIVIVSLLVPFIWMYFDDSIGQSKVFLFCIFLCIVARTGVKIVESWFVRVANLAFVSVGKLINSIVEAASSLVAGLAGFGAAGLMIAYALAPAVAFGFLFTVLWVRQWDAANRPNFRGIEISQVHQTWREYHWSATVATAASAVNSMSMTMMLFALGYVFDASQLGFFALVRRMTLMPVSLVSNALSQSFWAQAAKQVREGKYLQLRSSYLRITKLLGGASIVLATVCYLASKLIIYVFGSQWAPAGPILIAMIPYLIGLLMFSPTNHLIVFNRQDLQIFIDGTRILLVLISAVLALKLNLSLVITVWLMSISSLIGHVLLFLLQLTLQNRLADRISPGG